MFGEQVGDGGLFPGFDERIEILKRPSDLGGQPPADRRLSAAHESHQIDARRTFERQVHSEWLSFTRRNCSSAMRGNRRAAATRAQPSRGVMTVRLSFSIPRKIAAAHCSGVMAMPRAFQIFDGGL